MNWGRTERAVAKLFGGQVVNDRERQFNDIDVQAAEITISVKNQFACSYTGNISLELALFNAAGEAIPGNWYRCRADALAIAVKRALYVWDTKSLNAWVYGNWDGLVCKRLRHETVMTNIELGREYCDALNLLIPLNKIEQLGDKYEI